MIINIASSTIKKIWDIFLLIFFLFLFLYALLIKGIFIEDINLISSKINRLYIKLDKKLIVKIDKIEIKRNENSKNSKEEIFQILNKFKYFKKFFKEIDIEKIKFKDNEIKFHYFNNVFEFDSKHLFLRSLANLKQKNLYMDISRIDFKDFNISSYGKLSYNFINSSGYFDGNFKIFNIKGSCKLFLNNDILKFYLSSDKFDSLDAFMNFLEKKISLQKDISSWIYKKIRAKKYKLKYFEGSYDLKERKFNLKDALGVAKAWDAKIKFHPKLKSVKTKEITVILKNRDLHFKLKEPFFYDKNLSGSFVTITSLGGGERSGIDILLKIRSPLDKRIHEILDVYSIKVPVFQTKGISKGFLDIKLPHFDLDKIDVKGEFKANDSKFLIDNKLEFFVKKANVLLDNNFITINKSDITYDNLFKIKTSGIIDIKKQSFNGDVFINSFLLKSSNEELLNIKDVKVPVKLLAGDEKIILAVPSFSLNAYFSKNKNFIFIKYLSKIAPYSSFLKKYKINSGSLDIRSNDLKKFSVYANLKNLKTPFVKEGKRVKDLKLNIYIDPKFVSVLDIDNSLLVKIFSKEMIIKLNGIDLVLDNLKKENDLKENDIKIELLGDKSNIIFSKKTLICSNYDAILKKGDIDFVCRYGGDKLSFIKKRGKISVFAKNVSDFFINSLNKKQIFLGGRFSFSLKQKNKDEYYGKLEFKNTTMKELEVFNNLMAFINTIPSLLFLQNPNFSQNGYKIKKGFVNFIVMEDIVTVTDMKIEGYSADISGSGYVNMRDKSMDMDLQISTLQNIDKIIKHIPLLGYIVLGKDKRNSLTVKIRGSLDNPKVETYIIKDIFQMPFNIIKRTLNAPFEIFLDEKSGRKE